MEDKNIIYGGDFPLELGKQTFGEYFLKKALENGAQQPLVRLFFSLNYLNLKHLCGYE